VNGKKAVPEMSKDSSFSLGKSPFIIDDTDGEEVQVYESVACIEYLIERYGSGGKGVELLPPVGKWAERSRASALLSFCETPFTHALPIVYSQWFMPEGNEKILETLTSSMATNVQKDLDFYESTIAANKEKYGPQDGLYLANGRFSAADIANAFSAEYVLTKAIGTEGKKWPNIEAWLKLIEARPGYKETKKVAGLHDFTLLEREGGNL
jgi:glutathione S-transferase